ncbi:cell division suppressor protein YneA [Evansella cellulosilytica]|uniref:Peptidoglycan-binding lysin domain n=1 Tax=Evansella cellulosilytica (strain ATCC 21833 / DSM 2522 / FERM P-1141 / JCM 9156 / N-4) TaxID=649639 RepID=E6TS02_EVAC2|nr:LysM peptidoglycan-binding domain-containing protein [Evansella cellulosilytica]ADU30656.1 Peptidoglycan-binding lysin domain [Evansella cellulosilytica DSM 2522]
MNLLKTTKKNIDSSIFLIFLAIGLFVWTSVSANEPVEDKQFITVEWVVTEGESLWHIAANNVIDTNMSVEQLVYWIKKENNLDKETIYPGQLLNIPIELTEFAGQ